MARFDGAQGRGLQNRPGHGDDCSLRGCYSASETGWNSELN
jgi:hypothetical protein